MKDLKDIPPSSQVEVRLWTDAEGNLSIAFEPFNPAQKIVIDPTAMKSFNNTLTERVQGMDPRDPKVLTYLKEYSEKWLDEMWRSSYVLLEDVSAQEMSGENLYKPWKYHCTRKG